MKNARFDGLAWAIARRQSRRTTVKGAAAAVGAAVFGATLNQSVTAQDVPATPDAPFDEDASFLFVQSAASGTLAPNPGAGTSATDGTPTPGGGADYLLTLEGHTGTTVYLSDRPERIFGEGPTQQFLSGLGFPPDNPPNAAIVAQTAEGEDVAVVELLAPAFDQSAGTLTYGVNILSEYEGTGLAHVAARQQDDQLSEELGSVSLFIDDCPNITNCYFGPTSITIGALPGGPVGTCWSFSAFACLPCDGGTILELDQQCNDAYPECHSVCVVFFA